MRKQNKAVGFIEKYHAHSNLNERDFREKRKIENRLKGLLNRLHTPVGYVVADIIASC